LAEIELEPAVILRRTRIEVMPYVREIRRRRRALLPRVELTKRWIKYYEDLSKIRPLRPREVKALERRKKVLAFYEARHQLYREMSVYARFPTPRQATALRLAQTRYYKAKAEIAPPEEAEAIRKRLLAPPELYKEWSDVFEEIEETCKRYIEVKEWLIIITPVQRYIRRRCTLSLESIGEQT